MKAKRSPGRPRIPERKKRKIYICVGCSTDEIKRMNEKSEKLGVKRSTFVRMAVEKFKCR